MKRFNVTGLCIPERHYMADVRQKVAAIEKMVEDGSYFVINRPRQYGKTTMMYLLEKELYDKYIVISISFEGLGDEVFSNINDFGKAFFRQISKGLEFSKKKELGKYLPERNYGSMDEVGEQITELVKKAEDKILLMIDEVDKSSNNQLFLNFIGMLRDKYLKQISNKDATFHSVILAGVHDVKNLKLKLRPEAEKKLNSPWNIAADFMVDMSLHPEEIEPMLLEYARDHRISIPPQTFSEKLYYYTNGYPFLVSRLCQIVDERILGDNKRDWTLNDLELAVDMLSKQANTLFDDLAKNLENNHDLYQLVHELVILGEEVPFNRLNPIIDIGILYGIFKNEDGKVEINNRVFEQVICDYMTSKLRTSENLKIDQFRESFKLKDGTLDMERVLKKFQLFMKEQYSSKDEAFLEKNGRLLFLAFLKPVINGHGYDFKEAQISEEKRLDVVITYNKIKYVVELKVCRGEAVHKKGLNQLGDYLDRLNLKKGYLLIFDFGKKKKYKSQRIRSAGKDLFVVWT